MYFWTLHCSGAPPRLIKFSRTYCKKVFPFWSVPTAASVPTEASALANFKSLSILKLGCPLERPACCCLLARRRASCCCIRWRASLSSMMDGREAESKDDNCRRGGDEAADWHNKNKITKNMYIFQLLWRTQSRAIKSTNNSVIPVRKQLHASSSVAMVQKDTENVRKWVSKGATGCVRTKKIAWPVGML